MSWCLEGVKEYCIGLTMPFSLEDSSKGSRTYPLTQSDLTLRDFPVVTGVPSPQGFLLHRTFNQHSQTHRWWPSEKWHHLSQPLTILLRSSDEDEDLRSLCWHGDFCGTLTFVREPGKEAGGVADSPVVEPGGGSGMKRRETREDKWEE